jgi:uncharacterized membrane protein HdeD (DUF308 family)
MAMNLASSWWALALRGAVAILFGILALAFPPAAMAALVLLYGAWAIADGIFILIAAFRMSHEGERWGWLVFEGAVSIACGVLAFVWPGLTALVLVILIAAWSVVTGIAEIAAAIRLRKVIHNEWLLGLSGVLSIAFGILLFVFPAAGLLAIAVWIGAFAILFGALMVGLAFRLRAWIRGGHAAEIPQHA